MQGLSIVCITYAGCKPAFTVDNGITFFTGTNLVLVLKLTMNDTKLDMSGY